MKRPGKAPRAPGKRIIAVALCVGALHTGQAPAGGLMLYEIGTADVGLASAGYGARAQDASTVMTNPAGMTRLEGTQVLAGAQLMYGDIGLSLSSTPNTAGGGDGGNPIGWLPGASFFISHSVSPDFKVGFGLGGNFGLALKFDDGWAGRYYGKEAMLMGLSLMPSAAWRVNDKLSLGATVNAMYGILKNKTAINNITPGAGDGELKLDDRRWGYGVNLGLMYEADPGTRFGLTYNSEIKLDFSAPAEFSGVAPGLDAVLTARGLKNANVDLGIKVPQGVMGSVFQQVDDRWAVLASVGWQEWSKFGRVEVGIDASNPQSLTTDLRFKDTWHVALGGQYRRNDVWLYSFGVAYDSKFQEDNVSPLLPANDAWRFGIGAQHQTSKTDGWGVAAEYLYGGTLDTNKSGGAPLALGGRGDVVGSFNHTGMFFLSGNRTWKF